MTNHFQFIVYRYFLYNSKPFLQSTVSTVSSTVYSFCTILNVVISIWLK